MIIDPNHAENARIARSIYLSSRNSENDALEWQKYSAHAQEQVLAALRASDFLQDIESALQQSGGHTLVFRHMLAPPISQDQLRILCPTWSKSSEIKSTPLSINVAVAVADVFRSRFDLDLFDRLAAARNKPADAIAILAAPIVNLIAFQRTSTQSRGKSAGEQENSVIELLEAQGWTKLKTVPIREPATIPPKSFMYKTRFAAENGSYQEVDIACGLSRTSVLAMECKVTNDETNSVKRINDIIKKADAWQRHWGNFVVTAALLQGVIKDSDVQRLADRGVEVFWSHDLPAFNTWLQERTRT
jgi:hypothetical protein